MVPLWNLEDRQHCRVGYLFLPLYRFQRSNPGHLACTARIFPCYAISLVLGSFLTCSKRGQVRHTDWQEKEESARIGVFPEPKGKKA